MKHLIAIRSASCPQPYVVSSITHAAMPSSVSKFRTCHKYYELTQRKANVLSFLTMSKNEVIEHKNAFGDIAQSKHFCRVKTKRFVSAHGT
jgi:hypothetical protein